MGLSQDGRFTRNGWFPVDFCLRSKRCTALYLTLLDANGARARLHAGYV